MANSSVCVTASTVIVSSTASTKCSSSGTGMYCLAGGRMSNTDGSDRAADARPRHSPLAAGCPNCSSSSRVCGALSAHLRAPPPRTDTNIPALCETATHTPVGHQVGRLAAVVSRLAPHRHRHPPTPPLAHRDATSRYLAPRCDAWTGRGADEYAYASREAIANFLQISVSDRV